MEQLLAPVPILSFLGILAGAIAALGIIWKGVRTVLRFLRKITEFLEDWRGESKRPGHTARPGVMERLESVEAHQKSTDARLAYMEEQFKPNGGGSLYDKITRIDKQGGEGQ